MNINDLSVSNGGACSGDYELTTWRPASKCDENNKIMNTRNTKSGIGSDGEKASNIKSLD